MARLTHIAPASAAVHTGIAAAVLGLIPGVLYAFGGAVFDMTMMGGANRGTFLAFGALIGMPIYFGVIGAVTGGLGAWVYNRVAATFGGIEMRFRE